MALGLRVGLVADTHGVFDPVAAEKLQGTQLLLHAGDVGHHGGHEDAEYSGQQQYAVCQGDMALMTAAAIHTKHCENGSCRWLTEILRQFAKATGVPVLAVAGNVDDNLDGPSCELLPGHRLLTAAGWRVLLLHEVASGPQAKVCAGAADLIESCKPDIVVFGHSHKAAKWQAGNVHFINPGSAGPARFKLPRTVATLWLPNKSQEHDNSEATETSGLDATSPVDLLQSTQQAVPRYAREEAPITWSNKLAMPSMGHDRAVGTGSNTPAVQSISGAKPRSGADDAIKGDNANSAIPQDVVAQPQLTIHTLQAKAPKRLKQSTPLNRKSKANQAVCQ